MNNFFSDFQEQVNLLLRDIFEVQEEIITKTSQKLGDQLKDQDQPKPVVSSDEEE